MFKVLHCFSFDSSAFDCAMSYVELLNDLLEEAMCSRWVSFVEGASGFAFLSHIKKFFS